MNYETLDTIADAYIPALAIILFCTLIFITFKNGKQIEAVKKVSLYFICLIITSFGLMFIDNTLSIWPSINLDYSTHTAVSFTFVLSLNQIFVKRWQLIILSFILYLVLMVYQQYHSIADILTTLIPIGLMATIFYRVLFLAKKKKEN
ncbi:hypothetical protein [Zooshikella harenae]|uniref:Phosphatase PAP2 family protein n=1 Tax=Zooshikella harenae TaxID=2827238 RepID=A0ABS5ZKF7_9GAMM|nr:hypothetical protein [Zooshikella harenae]MBU2713472.1 hypothetical protein [Zooshikella harenae]